MASIQSSSALLTKFPAEIRLQIYKYAIVGASRHVHIILHKAQRPGGIRHVSKIRSYQCNHDFDSLAMNDFEIHAPAYGNPPLRPYYLPPLPSERGLGPLTLLKTCRQVYLEAIDLLYREQTFTFTSLAQPPFFIHSVLPERLAQIRSIQLIYNQRTMKRICILNTASGLHAHRLQTCPACNLKSWLDSIGWYMKGLRTIEVFIYLRTEMRGLHMDDPWIVRLLKLQQGANGLRDMRIRVYPGACHCGPIHAIEENCPPRRWASELEAWLQEGTERGVEASAKARTHAIDRSRLQAHRRRSRFRFYAQSSTQATDSLDMGSGVVRRSKKAPKRINYWFWHIIQHLVFWLLLLPLLIWMILVLLVVVPSTRIWRCFGGEDKFDSWFDGLMDPPGEIFSTIHEFCEKEEEVWDLEMGRPPALPTQRKRDLSPTPFSERASPCIFLTKLPPELRLQIYEYVLVGESKHIHIAVQRTQRPGKKRPQSRIHGFTCDYGHCWVPSQGSLRRTRRCCEPTLPADCGRGRLALAKTCRQIYDEVIGLLYSSPTFHIDSPTLSQPPYFLSSILPRRLSLIKNLHLSYNQATINSACTSGTSAARHQHRTQSCAFCNINRWLDLIKRYLTNLQTLSVTIYLQATYRVPCLGDAWLVRVFDLQHGANGLRTLTMRAEPVLSPGILTASLDFRAAERFDALLQERIRRGAEAVGTNRDDAKTGTVGPAAGTAIVSTETEIS
ncbi:hypothetical protein MMC28_003156 [Mycoblastus sanguinarius]|nr:hypothetical protein [Mycoblastus sanguinarius]